MGHLIGLVRRLELAAEMRRILSRIGLALGRACALLAVEIGVAIYPPLAQSAMYARMLGLYTSSSFPAATGPSAHGLFQIMPSRHWLGRDPPVLRRPPEFDGGAPWRGY